MLVGIALGSAVFTSVRLSVHATIDSFSRSMNLVTGNCDFSLIRPGGRVPDTLVATMMGHTSVQSASPVLSASPALSAVQVLPALPALLVCSELAVAG